MTYKLPLKSTAIKSLLAASLLLPLFPFSTPAAAADGLSVWLDGKAIQYQQASVIVDGATYVPLRETLEALGVTVEWNAQKGSMWLKKGALKTEYNPKQHRFDGVKAPFVQHDRLMVHIRTFDYLLGLTVGWDAEHNAVRLSSEVTQLFEAIQSSDLAALESALQRGADPNSKLFDTTFGDKSPALEHAIWTSDVDIINALIEAGAKLNQDVYPSLSKTIYGANPQVIKTLLLVGADPNEKGIGDGYLFPEFSNRNEALKAFLAGVAESTHGKTLDDAALKEAFASAIAGHNAEGVRALLEFGADANEPTEPKKADSTPLFMATKVNDPVLIKLLIEHGADPNAKNEEGYTAWMLAQAYGNSLVADALVQGGAQTTAVVPDILGADRQQIYSGTNVNSILHMASYLGDTAKVKEMLASSDPISQDTKDQVLVSAVTAGHLEIAQLALETGANVNQNVSTWRNLLSEVALTNHTEMIKLLLTYGAELKETDLADIEIPEPPAGAFYIGALQIAAEKGNPEVLRILLADERLKTEPYQTSIGHALNTAVAQGNIECFTLLLQSNINQTLKDHALYMAVNVNNAEAAKLLIKAGANPQYKGWKGQTSVELAEQKNNRKLLSLLQSTIP